MSNFYVCGTNVWDNVEFWKQNSEENYVECIQDLIQRRPFGDRKFYIFSFVKRVDDSSGIKKMHHQPRLTRPEPVPGSTLMKVHPDHPEEAYIIWTLPNQENFKLYSHGKMFSDAFVHDCIAQYQSNPQRMMQPDPEDPPEEEMRRIYREIREDMLKKSPSAGKTDRVAGQRFGTG